MENNESEVKSYHLTVHGSEEKDNVIRVLKIFLPREGTIISTGYSTMTRNYDIIIKLTEEELSYIKLSCNIIKTVVVDDWVRQQDTVNHVGSILAGM
jgi:hypothetical protein